MDSIATSKPAADKNTEDASAQNSSVGDGPGIEASDALRRMEAMSLSDRPVDSVNTRAVATAHKEEQSETHLRGRADKNHQKMCYDFMNTGRYRIIIIILDNLLNEKAYYFI